MCDYYDKLCESEKNPTELISFESTFHNDSSKPEFTGSLLNGKSEGSFVWYFRTGAIEANTFFKDGIYHGENIRYNKCGAVLRHVFYKHQVHIEELDYLVNEPRDEAFYFTLSLYGIDKEYTIGAE